MEDKLVTVEADYNQIKQDRFELGLILNSFPLDLRHIKK